MYKIVFNKNHYELYYNDKFVSSDDNLHEIEHDKEKHEKERMNKNANKTRKTRFTN